MASPQLVTRRSSRRSATQTVSYAEPELTDASMESATPPPQTPAKTRGAKRGRGVLLGDDEYGLADLYGKGAASDSPLSDLESETENTSPKKRKSPKKKARRAAPSATEDGGEAVPSPVKRPRKPRAPKPEPVYVIPDVEKKSTTFKGRLGYACLNTILRNKKPADMAVFCSRTCRIDTIKDKGIEWAKELGRQNVKDMLKLIEWNEKNNIRFMRMSSEMFPFASHPEYGYSLEYASEELAAVGALANKYGHRLTTHPGQFTQLGSPRAEVVRNAVRDLAYHCEMIDRMGLGKDSVMIIHGGGVYGDKPAALERIKKSYVELLPQNIKDRLVLENDEMCYSAEDLLPMCEELQIPLVFDYHHDWILPSSIGREEIIRRANAIFAAKGIKPKQHLSEPRPGAVTVMERRAHADRCQTLPDELPDDMDLMIEAKDKEQAVLHLYRIYDLAPVIHESLRPPAEVQTTQTKGRKSHKPTGTGRKKATKSGIVAEDDEVKGEDPAVIEDGEGGEHDELGEEAKAEEHGYSDEVGPVKSPTKKKRGPKVKGEEAGVDDAKAALPPVKKKRTPRKAKVEPVDPTLPNSPQAAGLPAVDTVNIVMEVTDIKPLTSPAKRRRTSRTAKALPVEDNVHYNDTDLDSDTLVVPPARMKRTSSRKAKGDR